MDGEGEFVTVVERAGKSIAILDAIVWIAVKIDIHAHCIIRFAGVECHIHRSFGKIGAIVSYQIGHFRACDRCAEIIGLHRAVLVENDAAFGHVAELECECVVLTRVVGGVGGCESPPGLVFAH